MLLLQFGSNNKVESCLVSFRTHPKGIHDSMNGKQKGNLEEHEPSVGNNFFVVCETAGTSKFDVMLHIKGEGA